MARWKGNSTNVIDTHGDHDPIVRLPTDEPPSLLDRRSTRLPRRQPDHLPRVDEDRFCATEREQPRPRLPFREERVPRIAHLLRWRLRPQSPDGRAGRKGDARFTGRRIGGVRFRHLALPRVGRFGDVL